MWLYDGAMDKHPLKAWRDDNQLSQEAAADLLRVKPMTVSRWERGSHLPNKKHWPRIEEATGIAPSKLVDHVKVSEGAQ
jgi:transcriptional regulator with XRE-family HTH domain